MAWRLNCVMRLIGFVEGCRSVRNDNLNYRATLRVACRSGRSASDLAFAARRSLVTQSAQTQAQ